jgi:hypothetical protein
VELEPAALERLVDMTIQDLQRGEYPDETVQGDTNFERKLVKREQNNIEFGILDLK